MTLADGRMFVHIRHLFKYVELLFLFCFLFFVASFLLHLLLRVQVDAHMLHVLQKLTA